MEIRRLPRANPRVAWVIPALAALCCLLPPGLAASSPARPASDAPAADTLDYFLEPGPYLIAPGDQLFVDFGLVLDERPIQAMLLVRPDGVVTLPRVGDLHVVGLTTTGLDSLLSGLYRDVYVNAKITVAVNAVAGNQVYVLGEVERAGACPMTPNVTALQAIAQAGGFRQDAARGDVLVIRRTGRNQVAVKKINLKALLSGRVGTADMLLRRFDIVYVNRSSIGDVRSFLEQTLEPLITAGDAYMRGWWIFNMDRIYPTVGSRPDVSP